MSYIPPHLRNSARRNTPTGRAFQTYNQRDIETHFGCERSHTLSCSVNAPETLSYILVHKDQHPEFPILFAHSNLHVLSLLCDGTATAEGRQTEFPLFKELPWFGNRFEFDGWVRIARVTLLAPHSEELQEMLGKKFKSRSRDVDAWRESLKMSWAEVTVEKIDPQQDAPVIASSERTEKKRFSRDLKS
jgi:hypothetical protein